MNKEEIEIKQKEITKLRSISILSNTTEEIKSLNQELFSREMELARLPENDEQTSISYYMSAVHSSFRTDNLIQTMETIKEIRERFTLDEKEKQKIKELEQLIKKRLQRRRYIRVKGKDFIIRVSIDANQDIVLKVRKFLRELKENELNEGEGRKTELRVDLFDKTYFS